MLIQAPTFIVFTVTNKLTLVLRNVEESPTVSVGVKCN